MRDLILMTCTDIYLSQAVDRVYSLRTVVYQGISLVKAVMSCDVMILIRPILQLHLSSPLGVLEDPHS